MNDLTLIALLADLLVDDYGSDDGPVTSDDADSSMIAVALNSECPLFVALIDYVRVTLNMEQLATAINARRHGCPTCGGVREPALA